MWIAEEIKKAQGIDTSNTGGSTNVRLTGATQPIKEPIERRMIAPARRSG